MFLLGSIGGVATIGAASDESSVVDYAVYWGLTSTVKMPGGSPGLNAEFLHHDFMSSHFLLCGFLHLGQSLLDAT